MAPRSHRPVRRRAPARVDRRRRFLLFTEGARTEVDYFEDLKRRYKDRAIIVVDRFHGTPEQLVERARKKRRSARTRASGPAQLASEQSEEVWCVFDVDEHRWKEAAGQAQKLGFGVAISNPCFELWLLLHFRPQSAHVERRRI